MKNNFLGYIFIIIIMVVVGFSIYKVKVKNSKVVRNFKFNFEFIKLRSSESYRNDTWNIKL